MEISVIIPVKNGEKYLSQCLDSVFNQSFDGDYEVILGIDPSDDKTNEIALEYQKNHSNLIVENRRGLGVQINRMDSIKKAKGKYLCFLDADDYYDKDYLKVMHEEISKGYDVINCSFKIDKNGKISNNLFAKNKELDSPQACKAILLDTYMRSFLWSKIFKRELFEIENIPSFKSKTAMFEDTMLVYYLFMHTKKVKSISNPLYYYRDNASSATKSERKERFEYHINVFAYIRHLCDENENKQYLTDFRKTMFRSKMSLFYDGHVSRHVLGHGGLAELKRNKEILKDLKNQNKMDINRYPSIKQFIEESKKSI